MINHVEDVLALEETQLNRAIAQEVLGMENLIPGDLTVDGVVMFWVSDEQELAIASDECTRSMENASGLLRSIGDQLSPEQRLRLTHTSAACLGTILSVPDNESDNVLVEVVSTLGPLQMAQAFLAAWRYEVEHYGALPNLSDNFLVD